MAENFPKSYAEYKKSRSSGGVSKRPSASSTSTEEESSGFPSSYEEYKKKRQQDRSGVTASLDTGGKQPELKGTGRLSFPSLEAVGMDQDPEVEKALNNTLKKTKDIHPDRPEATKGITFATPALDSVFKDPEEEPLSAIAGMTRQEWKPSTVQMAKEAIIGEGTALNDLYQVWAEGVKNVRDIGRDVLGGEEMEVEPGEVLRGAGRELGDVPEKTWAGFSDFVTREIPRSIITVTQAFWENVEYGDPSVEGSMAAQFEEEGTPTLLNRERFNEFKEDISDNADFVLDFLKKEEQARMQDLEVNTEAGITDPSNFAYQLGSGGASLALAMGIGVLSKSTGIAASVLGTVEGSGTYTASKEALRESNPDMSEDEVRERALRLMLIDSGGIAALEKVGLDALFRNYAGPIIRKAGINMITESQQEGAQTLYSNMVAKYGYDSEQELGEDVFNSMFIAGPLGFFGGGATGSIQKYQEGKEQARRDEETVRQWIQEQYDPNQAPILPSHLDLGMNLTIQEGSQAEEAFIDSFAEQMDMEREDAEALYRTTKPVIDQAFDEFQDGSALRQQGLLQEKVGREIRSITRESGEEQAQEFLQEEYNMTEDQARTRVQEALDVTQESQQEVENIINEVKQEVETGVPAAQQEEAAQQEVEAQVSRAEEFTTQVRPDVEQVVGTERVQELPELARRETELKQQIDQTEGDERQTLVEELNEVVGQRRSTEAEITQLEARREAQGNLLSEAGQRTAEIFAESGGQEQIPNTDYEIGDFGRSSQARKLDVKEDRFPESELSETLNNTVAVRRASNDRTNLRYDNIAHIARMDDGSLRAVYTRQNEAGNEEVVNWHEISNEDFLDDIMENAAPDRSRFQNLVIQEQGDIEQQTTENGGRTFEEGDVLLKKEDFPDDLADGIESDIAIQSSTFRGNKRLFTVAITEKTRLSKDLSEEVLNKLEELTGIPFRQDSVSSHVFHGEIPQEELREVEETTEEAQEELQMTEEEREAELGELRENLQEVYRETDNAEEALGNLLVELELAEPGQRIFQDGNVTGFPSTFPAWMSEEVRNSNYVETVLGIVSDIESIQYPTNPRASRQRRAVDDLLTALDEELGIDTSDIRGNILNIYGEEATQTTEAESQQRSQRGEGGDQAVQDAIERFQVVEVDILTYSQEELDNLSDEELNQELLDLSDEEMDALVMSDQGNRIFHQMNERLSEENISKYAGYLHDNNLDVTNFDDFQGVTTNVLEAIGDRDNVHKNFIKSKLNEVHKNIGVRKSERDLIEGTLEDMEGDRVDVAEFKNRVKSKILPLNIQGINEPTLMREELDRLYQEAREEGTEEAWQRAERYEGRLENRELGRYEDVVLPETIRGDVQRYDEHVIESPIQTSAGDVHRFPTDHYFAHTRLEDMADGETRRIIEVQSDLMQRGRLDREAGTPLDADFAEETDFLGNFKDWLMTEREMSESEADNVLSSGSEEAIDLQGQFERVRLQRDEQRISPLRAYENYWWERAIREEVKQAAVDRKGKLQFPRGETAMNIEGLGAESSLFWNLETDDLNVGNVVEQGNQAGKFVITNVSSDTEFSAIRVRNLVVQEGTEVLVDGEVREVAYQENKSLQSEDVFMTIDENGNPDAVFLENVEEFSFIPDNTFEENYNINDEIDISNPIYRFYEKDVAKFLRKNYDAKEVTDENGVEWMEIDIQPEMAAQPVIAYKKSPAQGVYRDSPHLVEIKAIKDDVPFDMTQEQGQEWFSHLFGNSVRQMPFDIEQGGPRKYWGSYTAREMYDKSLIKFATFRGQVQSRVIYHEGFHGAFRMLLTKQEQQELLDNVKNNIPARFTQEIAMDKEAYFTEDQRAEEWLADDFARFYEWKMKMRSDKAHAIENEKWYETLLRKIRDWIRKTTGAQEVYMKILERVDRPQLAEERQNLDSMIIEGADIMQEFENIDMNEVLKAINDGRKPQSGRIPEVYDMLKEDYQQYQEEGEDRSGVLGEFYKAIDNYKQQGEVQETEETLYKATSEDINQYTLKEENRKEAFRRKVQDQNARIDIAQQQLLEQGAVVNEESDVFLAKTLMPRRIGARFGELKDEIERPFVEGLVNDGLTIEEMDLYAHALHAPRRNEIMRDQRDYEGDDGSGMTNERAQEIIDNFREQGKLELLEKHREKLRKVQKTIHAFQLENGLISREELKAWIRIYGEDYVPLHRDIGESETGVAAGRTGQGIDTRGRESKRAKGSARDVLPITAGIFNQYRKAIMRSEHNRVGRTLFNFIKDNNDNGEMNGLFKIHKQQYIPRYDKDGELLYMDPHFIKDDNFIGLKIDGDQYYIEIKDEKYARALRETGLTSGFATSAKFVRFLSSMITQYSPEFMLRNMQRDFFEGMINLQETNELRLSKEERRLVSTNVAKDTPGMIKALYRFERGKNTDREDLIKRFKKAGGEVGYFWTVDNTEAMANLQQMEAEVRNEGAERVKKPAKKLGEFIDAGNTAAELGVRLSVFNQLTQRGVSDARAAEIAGDLTVDFNKMGEWGPLMKSLWVFSNPAIQGPAKMFRALSASKRVRIASAAMVMGGFINGVISMMLGGDADDDIPEYTKNTKISFATPGGKQVTVFFLPYGYNIFWAAGRNMAELVFGRKTVSETVTDTLLASLDAFNPLGGSRFSFTNFLPTAVKPLGEISINEGWHGGPVSPEQEPYTPKVPDSQLYWDSVGKTSKFIAQTLNKWTGGNERESGLIDLSPESIEYAVGSYTGTVGTLVQNMFDTTATLVAGEKAKAKNIPFVRDYYRNIDTKRAKQEVIYEMLDESGRTDFGELRTERFNNALDVMVERDEMEPGYAEKLRSDFRNNQSELRTGMDLEENAISKALEKYQLGELSEGDAFREAKDEVLGDDAETREITNLRKKFRLHDTFGFNDPLVEQVNSARSNDERAQILLDMKNEMDNEAFQEFMRKGRRTVETASGRTTHVLISDDLLKKYKRLRDNQ